MLWQVCCLESHPPVVPSYLGDPDPNRVLEKAVFVLQKSTTEVTYLLLKLGGVPVLRRGFQLSTLPGADVKIAEQCSGIRSSIALSITALLCGHIFLRSGME